MKATKPLKGVGIRISPAQLAAAQKLGLNIGDITRRALDEEILKRQGHCPTCGVKVPTLHGPVKR